MKINKLSKSCKYDLLFQGKFIKNANILEYLTKTGKEIELVSFNCNSSEKGIEVFISENALVKAYPSLKQGLLTMPKVITINDVVQNLRDSGEI